MSRPRRPQRVGQHGREGHQFHRGHSKALAGQVGASDRGDRQRRPGREEPFVAEGPQQRASEPPIGEGVQEGVTRDDDQGDQRRPNGGEPRRLRDRQRDERDAQREHQGVRCAAMPPGILIVDTQAKPEHVRVWQQR